MWTKPYGMQEGLLIAGGLILAGLMLQLSVGPVVWDAFRWPVNGVALTAFLVIIATIFLLRKKVYGFQFIGTYKAAIPALICAVVLTIVMGLTPQTTDGTWLNDMLSFWPFVLIHVYIALILGLTVLRQFKTWAAANFSLLTFRFSLLLHLGLFIAMTAATLGSADMQRLKMITMEGETEWRALTADQQVVEMPIAIELKDFTMETYDDGSPQRFASSIQILTQTGKNIQTTVEVNKPVEVDGWKIYQYGYDTQMGPMSQTSIFELVSDPWLPLVYAGIYMMLAGAVCMLLSAIRRKTSVQWNTRTVLPLLLLLTVAFVGVWFFMSALREKNLMPALQSPWFRPHVIAYIFAYSLLGASAVIAVVGLFRLWSKPSQLALNDILVYAGLAFMTVGMLFGALWAKEAWGHYWSWDPKETWAAVTWFSYLVYVHYRQIPTHKPRLALWVLLISFVVLQMCWWGINYLPSAQGASVHVYGAG